jgi:zinc transport system substrate-binding protein
MRLNVHLVMLVSAALGGGACAAAAPAGAPALSAEAPPLKVFVTIPPQAWFVERIGGPRVAVHVLVGPGQSPHTFDPTPQQMARLADARIFFRIGWPLEPGLLEKARSINPNLQVIDTREGIALRWMTPAEAEADERAEGRAEPKGGAKPEAAPGHTGEADPHFWLNPRYARVQAATIEKALAAADPAHADEFRKNLAALDEDLDKLDARLREALAPLKGRDFFVYHPAFGYFADAYGLRQVPVEIEGKEPTARQLARLIDRARAEGVRVIFVQPQFSAKSAEAVATAIGGSVIAMDDLAKDYLANLADMAEKVRSALTGEKGAAQPQKQ